MTSFITTIWGLVAAILSLAFAHILRVRATTVAREAARSALAVVARFKHRGAGIRSI